MANEKPIDVARPDRCFAFRLDGVTAAFEKRGGQCGLPSCPFRRWMGGRWPGWMGIWRRSLPGMTNATTV